MPESFQVADTLSSGMILNPSFKQRRKDMIYLIGIAAFMIITLWLTAPLYTAAAQYFERKRLEREMEYERLVRENAERAVSEYLSQKKK